MFQSNSTSNFEYKSWRHVLCQRFPASTFSREPGTSVLASSCYLPNTHYYVVYSPVFVFFMVNQSICGMWIGASSDVTSRSLAENIPDTLNDIIKKLLLLKTINPKLENIPLEDVANKRISLLDFPSRIVNTFLHSMQ